MSIVPSPSGSMYRIRNQPEKIQLKTILHLAARRSENVAEQRKELNVIQLKMIVCDVKEKI